MVRTAYRALVCLALVGCGATLGTHDAHTARDADAHAAVALRQSPSGLRVEVQGRLGDAPVAWIVDTGSSGHSLTTGQAQRRGLFPKAGPLAPLHSGSSTIDWDGRLTAPVSIAVFDAGGAWTGPVPTRGDDRLDEEGIAGILSPQRLANADGAVELDLRHGTWFRLDKAAGASARDEVTQRGARLAACQDRGGGFVPWVSLNVDGREVSFIVDTGSPVTSLFADTAAGVSATMRTTGHVLVRGAWGPGTEADLALVPSAKLRVAGTDQALRVVVIARPERSLPFACHPDGLLGMDVLRGCTLVLDAGGGAIACEAPTPGVDTAPTLASLKRFPPPAPLAAHAPPALAGVVATLGCDTVTDADATSWARDRGVSVADAREQVVRARIFARAAVALHVVVTTDDVDRALAGIRAEHDLDDVHRAMVTDQLLAAKVTLIWGDVTGGSVSTAAEDALASRLHDRLGRAPTEGTGRACHEVWPSYYLEETVLLGLTPSDESAVRLALSGVLDGGVVSLGAPGTLPRAWIAAVARVFEPRGLAPQLTVLEEGTTLRVKVALAPRSQP